MDRYDPLSTDVKFRIKGVIAVQPEFSQHPSVVKPAESAVEAVGFNWDELADAITRSAEVPVEIAAVEAVVEAPAPAIAVPASEPEMPAFAVEAGPAQPAVEEAAVAAIVDDDEPANMSEPPEAPAWDPPIEFYGPPEPPVKPEMLGAIPFGGLVLYPVSGPVELQTRYPKPVREKILTPAPPLRITLVSGATVHPGSSSAKKHIHPDTNGHSGRYAGIVPQWRPNLFCVNAPVRAVVPAAPAVPAPVESAIEDLATMTAPFDPPIAQELPVASSLEDTLASGVELNDSAAFEPAPPIMVGPMPSAAEPQGEHKFEVVVNLAALGIFDD